MNLLVRSLKILKIEEGRGRKEHKRKKRTTDVD
jgi:hypothetical protein